MKKQLNLKKNNNHISFKQKYKDPLLFLWNYLKDFKLNFIFVVLVSILISLIICGVLIGNYYFLQFINDHINDGKDEQENFQVLIFLISLMVSIFIALFLYIFQITAMTYIAQYASKLMRKDLYFKLLNLKLKYFDSTPSGDIMSRLTNDLNNITLCLTQNITQFLTSITQIFFFLITLFLFSPILGLISLLFVPIQISVVYFLFKKAQPYFLKKQVALGDLNGFVEETISGQKIINNFNKQNLVIDIFNKKNEKLKDINYKSNLISSLSNPWNTLMTNILIATLFVVSLSYSLHDIELGGILIYSIKDGKTDPIATLSLLTAVMSFARNFSNPIYQIFQLLNLFQAAVAGVSRTMEIKNQKNETHNFETEVANNLKGNIQFKNLSFSYDGKNDVIKNINLNVKKGQVVGIVGPTGSGKTTIINLLTKFYDLEKNKGDILLDGTSIRNFTKNSLRNEVSIVLQDTFIFGDSIYENIRYSKPDATNEEIIEASMRANAHSFIMSLKNGYETILENNAEDISQGQRQLLAIARAFLKKSSILILDEATSSIDTKTEKDIQSAMIELSKGKTTFMIAHRLSTIKHADIIVVLKDGQIIEKGNHFELLKQNGFYANLYNSKLNTPEDI